MMHVYLMHVSMIHTYGAYIIDAYGGDPPAGYPEHDRGGEEEGLLQGILGEEFRGWGVVAANFAVEIFTSPDKIASNLYWASLQNSFHFRKSIIYNSHHPLIDTYIHFFSLYFQ